MRKEVLKEVNYGREEDEEQYHLLEDDTKELEEDSGVEDTEEEEQQEEQQEEHRNRREGEGRGFPSPTFLSTKIRCTLFGIIIVFLVMDDALDLYIKRHPPPSGNNNNNNNKNVTESAISVILAAPSNHYPSPPINWTRESDHSYICVTMDFWPSSKCDYGWCSWMKSSALTFPLSSDQFQIKPKKQEQQLRNALHYLSYGRHDDKHPTKPSSPVILRVGGSLADLIRFQPQPTASHSTKSPHTTTTTTATTETCQGFGPHTVHEKLGYNVTEGACMSQDRFHSLVRLCNPLQSNSSDNNDSDMQPICRFVFDLSALHGRTKLPCDDPNVTCDVDAIQTDVPPCCTQWTGHWDSTNAQSLLQYVHASRSALAGVQFGNELAGNSGVQAQLDVPSYVHGFCQLHHLLHTIWPNTGRPRLIGPDSTTWDPVWHASFRDATLSKTCSPDVVTWHQYHLGPGKDPNVAKRAMDPAIFDTQNSIADDVRSVWWNTTNIYHMPELWMGETGGAFNSGRPNTTDSFRSSFWYLDFMATLASRRHSAFCRQTLVGGNYGLLDRQTLRPNPDFYAAALFGWLMGKTALSVHIVKHHNNTKTNTPHHHHQEQDTYQKTTTINTKQEHDYFRAYAHCSVRDDNNNNKTVTLLLLNLSPDTLFTVKDVRLSPNSTQDPINILTFERLEWIISAESLDARQISLNGHGPLEEDFPSMPGRHVIPGNNNNHNDDNNNTTSSSSSSLKIEPHTYAFVKILGFEVDWC